MGDAHRQLCASAKVGIRRARECRVCVPSESVHALEIEALTKASNHLLERSIRSSSGARENEVRGETLVDRVAILRPR